MIYGQIKVNSAYKRYERIPNSRGITGAMVAREILDRNGLSDIQIHVVNGKLSDHYQHLEIRQSICHVKFMMEHRLRHLR